MNSLRDAAQAALEAMDSILLTCSLALGNDGIRVEQYMKGVTASRALRAALAQQAEPVCPDCRGLGYDSSGQLCGCQDKPSPCAYPNCVGGQAGTICKPSCPGGTK